MPLVSQALSITGDGYTKISYGRTLAATLKILRFTISKMFELGLSIFNAASYGWLALLIFVLKLESALFNACSQRLI